MLVLYYIAIEYKSYSLDTRANATSDAAKVFFCSRHKYRIKPGYKPQYIVECRQWMCNIDVGRRFQKVCRDNPLKR